MNQAFYDGMIIRIKGGQYTLDEIDIAIDKASGAGFFGVGEEASAVMAELKEFAREHVDPNYKGNREPRAYDYEQDIDIMFNTESNIELFDMVMLLMDSLPMALSKTEKVAYARTMGTIETRMMRSAIGENYTTLIIAGRRTFASVHISKKQEVADKLVERGYAHLVTEIDYLDATHAAQAIIEKRFVFDDVAQDNKQAIADILIAQGHEDLITDPEFKPGAPEEEIPLTPLEPSIPVEPEE